MSKFHAFLLFAACALAACNDPNSSKSGSASAGSGSSGGTTLTQTTPANAAPSIVGTPLDTVAVGTYYSFTPQAADSNGDTLTFSVQNAPAWTTFNTANGQLSGTPSAANVGTYNNIVVSVSDGRATTALAAFSIAVTQIATGSATLSWTPPTQNTDGSALTNLAGYRIHYGTSQSALNQLVQVGTPGLTTYTVGNLSPGTYYFALSAYSSDGTESGLSNTASKTVM